MRLTLRVITGILDAAEKALEELLHAYKNANGKQVEDMTELRRMLRATNRLAKTLLDDMIDSGEGN